MHHLTHATNEIDAAFSSKYTVTKSGIEAPNSDIEGGRGLSGHCENVNVDFTSIEEEDENGECKDGEGWESFLGRLRALEAEWERIPSGAEEIVRAER